MRKYGLLLPASLLISPSLFAQSIGIGSNRDDIPHPVDLLLNISVDRMQNSAPAGLTVQLIQESVNDASAPGLQQTDSSGKILFHTNTGIVQLRITGPGIEDYSSTLQLMRQESRHIENIVVRSKSSGAQPVSPPGTPDTISAAHLKAPAKAVSEFQAGSKALGDKNYPEARKRFEHAISIYGDYDVAYNGLGVAQMGLGDAPAARISFEQAVKLDDHFAEAYRNLARIALSDHKYEEVDDFLTKSIELDPLNAWALTYAAYAELLTHKFDAAIVHAQTAHSIAHPGLASVHIVAAHAFEATQRPDEALKEYRQYLKEDPTGLDAGHAKEAIARSTTSAPASIPAPASTSN